LEPFFEDPVEPPDEGIEWKDCRLGLPPLPLYPYKVYLVWVVQQCHGATGGPLLWQFSRELGDWLPLPKGPAGATQVVTHYSDVLAVLGKPGPDPWGPRGDDYIPR
jgi:hypothetical protein